STIRSKSYQRQVSRKNRSIAVYSKECPLFVPLVEEGITQGKIVDDVVEMYLKDMKGKIDTLILGCTHYPLLKGAIERYLKGVYLVDSAKEVARRTKEMLEDNNIRRAKGNLSKEEFFVTDEPAGFMKLAKIFLRREIKPKLVNI
ncbi:MAG: glutamate racemase, partial [Candidatus Omnitrophota bacterium]